MIILIMISWQFYTILPFYFSTTILLAHCGQHAPSLTCMTSFIQSRNCYSHSRKKSKIVRNELFQRRSQDVYIAMKWNTSLKCQGKANNFFVQINFQHVNMVQVESDV